MSKEIHAEEHSSLIKTPKQLIIVVVLAFVVPVGLIATIASLVVGSTAPGKGGPGMTEEAIAKRIQPAGEVAIDPNQPTSEPAAAPAPAAVAPAPTAVVAAAPAKGGDGAKGGDAAKGKSVYDSACMACHAAGVAGAPKAGDKTAWAPRVQTGMDTLYAAALKGKNAMPPRGGNASLADADVKAAVDYMVGLVK
ncbi:MAG: cytochrome c5 family protein [Burkholderiales bacterium]|nr:cytochrome c5 family protein [Burkholderiales bacterium]